MDDSSDLSHKRKRESHHNGSEGGIIKAAKIPKISQMRNYVEIGSCTWHGTTPKKYFVLQTEANESIIAYICEKTEALSEHLKNGPNLRFEEGFTTTERVYIDDKDITKGLIEDGVSVKKRSFDQIYISLWLKGEVEVMICEFVKKSLDKATFIDCLTSYWRSQDAVVPEVSVDLVKMSHYVEKPWVITTSSEGFSIIPKEVELNPIPIPFAIVKRITLYSQGIL